MQEKLKQERLKLKQLEANSPEKKGITKSPSSKMKGILGKPESVGKNRSKKALKRAQLVQRKKALEKQLQEARAKYLMKVGEDASSEMIESILRKNNPESIGLKDADTNEAPNRDSVDSKSTLHNASEKILKPADNLDTRLSKGRSRPLNFKTAEERSAFLAKRNNRRRKPKPQKAIDGSTASTDDNENITGKEKPVIGPTSVTSQNGDNAKPDGVAKLTTLVASITPDKVLGEKKRNPRSGAGRKRGITNKRASYEQSTIIKANTTANSRIIKGPSIYVRGTNIECPCTLAPLIICQRCGAFCHEDCINVDKICTLCVPA